MVNITDNDRGEAWQAFDPAGREKCASYDDAGRQIETIQNYSTATDHEYMVPGLESRL